MTPDNEQDDMAAQCHFAALSAVDAARAESLRLSADDKTRLADMVNHPPHYTAAVNGIECIDAIRAALTPEEFRGFCKGNALKYVWRERHKGGYESLAKAAWYLAKLTEAQS